MKQKQKQKLGFFKKNDAVETPRDLRAALQDRYDFDFDPCPLEPSFDGLAVEWGQRNFVNPPYSEIRKWVEKGIEQLRKGRLSVFLITVRTGGRYWLERIAPHCTDVSFLTRFRFEGYDKNFPVATCLAEFDPAKRPIFRVFDIGGKYPAFGYRKTEEDEGD